MPVRVGHPSRVARDCATFIGCRRQQMIEWEGRTWRQMGYVRHIRGSFKLAILAPANSQRNRLARKMSLADPMTDGGGASHVPPARRRISSLIHVSEDPSQCTS